MEREKGDFPAEKPPTVEQALEVLVEEKPPGRTEKTLRTSLETLWKIMDKRQRDSSTRWMLLRLLQLLEKDELDALGRLIIALLAAQKKNFSGEAQGEDVQARKTAGEAGRNVRKKKRVTIRVEYRKCGKDCRCNGGRGHGPYRYMYWWENGRLRSRYLGRA